MHAAAHQEAFPAVGLGQGPKVVRLNARGVHDATGRPAGCGSIAAARDRGHHLAPLMLKINDRTVPLDDGAGGLGREQQQQVQPGIVELTVAVEHRPMALRVQTR